LLTTACLNSSAPTQTAPATAAREVTDDLGRRVKVPEKIERVVSLAPNLTENVFAVGAGERLVGVTTYCNFPAEAQKISKVGDTINPNLETILALKPQLVLVSTASQIESFTRQMEERGIAVFVLNPKDFEGVLQNLRLLGDLLGTQSNAEKLVSDLQARVSLVENKISGEKPVRVFVQISREPLYTIGRASFLTDLIKRAGGESITSEVPEAYPKISKEMVLASQPEAVILSADDAMGEGNSTAADVLRDSPAVKDNRVYKINGDLLTRPSPRLVDGLEEIARALHPQVFR
jgi:iron complex transport system substrate-binding protein